MKTNQDGLPTTPQPVLPWHKQTAEAVENYVDVANIAMKLDECFGLTDGDPTESEDYTKFVESMAPHCHCTGQDRPCAGVLAGGLCDELHEDNESDEEESP